MDYFVSAGVGRVVLRTKDGTPIVYGKTFTETGINLSVSSADIRGGLANPLISRYFYDSAMSLTLTDALFNMKYIALNTGSTIKVGGNAQTTETITTDIANQITVVGTPVKWNNAGTYGVYSIAGTSEWKKIEFTGKTAQVNNLPVGTKVCVEYTAYDDTASQMTIPSAIIPDEVHCTLTLPLFSAGSMADLSTASVVAELEYEIPRFQLSGAVDLSLTSSGASTTPISGNALVSFEGTDCSNAGRYGTLTQRVFGEKWTKGLEALAVSGGNEIEMTSSGDTYKLNIIKIMSDGRTGTAINEKLTFTSGTEATCTVDNKGVITPVATGTSTITITATEEPTITCSAQVTVK